MTRGAGWGATIHPFDIFKALHVCQVTTSQKPAWRLGVLFVHLASWSPFPTVPFYMKHTVASKPCYCLFSRNVLFYMASKSMLEHEKSHMWSTPCAQSYILHMLHTVQYHSCVCVCVSKTLHYMAPAGQEEGGFKNVQLIQKAWDYSFPFSCGNKLLLQTVSIHSHTCVHAQTTLGQRLLPSVQQQSMCSLYVI